MVLAGENLCLHDVVVENERESFAEPLRMIIPGVEGRRYLLVSEGLIDKALGQVVRKEKS